MTGLISNTQAFIDFMSSCQSKTKKSAHQNLDSIIFIHTDELAWITAQFMKSFSCPSLGVARKLVAWKLETHCRKQEILRILKKSLELERDVRSVVVASSHVDCIHLIFKLVGTTPRLKWRRFFHAVEWFVLTINSLTTIHDHLDGHSLPDFVTLFYIEETSDMLQKSRLQTLHKVISTSLNISAILQGKNSFKSFQNLDLRLMAPSCRKVFKFSPMRREAVQFLSTQKSVMAGMRIPVAMFPDEQIKSVFLEREGNKTSWHGFYVDVLNLLSEALDFIPVPFKITDDSFFSDVPPDGNIKGVVGYLRRREAGLSTMAMANTIQRRQYINFVSPHILEKTFYIMYRAHFQESQMGGPKSELINTNTDSIFVLIGSCLVMVIGIFVLLVNTGLLKQENICRCRNFRHLYDFPLYWVFQTIAPCHYQSSRILRASWGLFCLVMFTAYSAILTSNATAPQMSPVIKNLEDLLATPNFKIGISPDVSYFMTSMVEAEKGTTHARLWEFLRKQNKSDPETFSTNKAYHLRKVLGGNYAFLGNVTVRLLPTLTNGSFLNVKIVTLHKYGLYVTVPKKTFFARELGRFLISATEMGFIKNYRDEWIPRGKYIKESKTLKATEMHMHRLLLLIYIIAGGVGLAFVTLAFEKCMRRVLSQ